MDELNFLRAMKFDEILFQPIFFMATMMKKGLCSEEERTMISAFMMDEVTEGLILYKQITIFTNPNFLAPLWWEIGNN